MGKFGAMTDTEGVRLRKHLGLLDIFALSTGAMFGSGFFLLPGLAAAQTGSSVAAAYLVAAILALPALLSVAELATAMPRAGGAYFFLERALGPLVGTVGGLGTWLALVLKSAFALLGMGAYLAILIDVPIKPLAVALTVVFAVTNIVGAKESAGLQRLLVYALVGILAYFIAEGIFAVLAVQDADVTWSNLGPLLPAGLDGFLATVGLVFVSYAGLTKVASVAEEVENPDRNLPLGMLLSLLTATVFYVIGVFLLNALIPPETFHSDLTPVATAVDSAFHLMPSGVALALVVVAAFAAFASTGNAGVMASSRYPYAMARDGLVPERFSVLNRFHTPTLGILATATSMIVFMVAFDIAAVAKLASAFQLMLFALLSVAVIVMRESGIPHYRPGFRSPLYPWVHLAGILVPMVLIAMMGVLAIALTVGVIAVCAVWYFGYVRKRVSDRTGAIYHVFERLGQRVHRGLDTELRAIVAERGIDEEPFEDVVERALVIDIENADNAVDFAAVIARAGREAEAAFGLDAEWLAERLRYEERLGFIPVAGGAALPHVRVGDKLEQPELLLIRIGGRGVSIEQPAEFGGDADGRIHAILMLLSPARNPALHLHLLAQLATRVQDEDFLPQWRRDKEPEFLRRTVLGHLRYHRIAITPAGPRANWIGKTIAELSFPAGVVVALIGREGTDFVPRRAEVLAAGDRLTIIGDPEVIRTVRAQKAGT